VNNRRTQNTVIASEAKQTSVRVALVCFGLRPRNDETRQFPKGIDLPQFEMQGKNNGYPNFATKMKRKRNNFFRNFASANAINTVWKICI